MEGSDGQCFYRFLDKVVGQGTYGEVVLAQRISADFYHTDQEEEESHVMGQLVCMKAISKHMIRQLDMEDLVAQEIQISQVLSADQNLSGKICSLLDILEDQSNIYMVMEYCSKGSLEHIYFKDACHEPLDERLVRKYALQMLHTLMRMHEVHFVCHRDLQPSNVVIDSRGNLRVIDFGCSMEYDEISQTLPERMVVGNSNYCPPEIVFGYPNHCNEKGERGRSNLYQKIDVWSCGVIIFQMATGYLPFRSHSVRALDWSDPDLMMETMETSYALPDWFDEEPISEDVKSLMRSMLTVNPSKRPTFRELINHPMFHKEESIRPSNP